MEWISCEKELPGHGEDVLFTAHSDIYHGHMEEYSGDVTWWACFDHLIFDVTHWCPLPPPPEKD